MTKYGRPLRFGYSPLPTASDPKRPIRLAEQAESMGLEYIGIQDHPQNPAHQDGWTLLTAIGVATSRISLFTNVADLPLRPPALLGKAAATLDLLTGGRLEVGLGTHSFRDPLVSMGGTKLSDQDALAALEEAIQIMRLMWSGERSARFEGKFYQLGGLHPGPAAARHINIWLSANDAQTLALIGRLADGWVIGDYPATQPSDLARLSKQIDDAAASAGREPSEIQRIWTISGNIDTRESSTLFQGSVQEWAESLADLSLNMGIDTFLLMEGENAEDQLRKFALEVVPHARELVELGPTVTTGIARAQQGASASGITPAEEETVEVDWVDETSMESFPASDSPGSHATA